MQNLFQVLIGSLRAKVIKYWSKLRLYLSPTFLKALWTGKLRQFFSSLLDIKPKSKEDYYTLSRWLVGKKLAFAAVVLAGALSLWYINNTLPVEAAIRGMVQANSKIPTYKYNSLSLRNYTGTARVAAAARYVAYEGQITDGVVTGQGTLYNKDGIIVYTGEFVDNMYNGQGKFYYDNADVMYEGQFKDNYFNGQGTLYNAGGTVAYTGAFEMNMKHGQGQLSDSQGSPLFQGRFYRDEAVFTDYLGKPTADMGEAFLAASRVYNNDNISCVTYPALNVMFETEGVADSLEGERMVISLFRLQERFKDGISTLESKADLDRCFGAPYYQGASYATFPEIAAIAQMWQQEKNQANRPFGDLAEPVFAQPFKEVFNLESYDANYELYICTYLRGGLAYTFYFENINNPYVMYCVEKAE